jgi:predicted NAD/FAD-dependent oxidoreductase
LESFFGITLQDMSLKPYRLLIVGAGLTASVTSALIKQHLPNESVEVHIWEKSRGIGGRMNTTRSPDGQASVDLGAQYITKSSQYAEKHKK